MKGACKGSTENEGRERMQGRQQASREADNRCPRLERAEQWPEAVSKCQVVTEEEPLLTG